MLRFIIVLFRVFEFQLNNKTTINAEGRARIMQICCHFIILFTLCPRIAHILTCRFHLNFTRAAYAYDFFTPLADGSRAHISSANRTNKFSNSNDGNARACVCTYAGILKVKATYNWYLPTYNCMHRHTHCTSVFRSLQLSRLLLFIIIIVLLNCSRIELTDDDDVSAEDEGQHRLRQFTCDYHIECRTHALALASVCACECISLHFDVNVDFSVCGSRIGTCLWWAARICVSTLQVCV